jgi:hypothetical protein
MINTKCKHGERVGKAGMTVSGRLPFAGMFCPEKVCEPIWFVTKFAEEKTNG